MKTIKRHKWALVIAATSLGAGCGLFGDKANQADPLPLDPIARNAAQNAQDNNALPGRSQAASQPTRPGYALDAMVGQVNGRPIYAATVLEPIQEQLQALGNQLPPSTFQKRVQQLVVDQLQEMVINSLIYGEAERDLSDAERNSLQSIVKARREELLRRWGRGSPALAEENLLREEGMSLEQMLEEHRQQVVVSRYLQKKLLPRINITRKDVERYYRDHPGLYNPPIARTLRLIRVSGQADADAIAAQLDGGKTFAEVASDPLNQHKADAGGLFGQVSGDAPLAMAPLNEAMVKLQAGQCSAAIAIDSDYWFVCVDKIDQPEAKSLTMVQLDIKEELRRQRFNTLRQRYLQKMFAEGSYNSLEDMAMALVKIAMNRYAASEPS